MNKNKDFPFVAIDLTHPLSSAIPTWNNSPTFNLSTTLDYRDCTGGTKFRVQKLSLDAGSGTHLDAPAHCIANGATITDLSLDRLITQCVVINTSHKSNPSLQITPRDIESFESRYGIIPPKSCVIFYTGWSRHWSNPTLYRNNLSFPTIHADTAHLLVTRGVYGIGIDTLSPDTPHDHYPAHEILLGAGIYIIENIANAKQLPPVGAQLLALPLALTHATEAPIRLIALCKTTKP